MIFIKILKIHCVFFPTKFVQIDTLWKNIDYNKIKDVKFV